jgi:hypothetical protein
MLAACVYNIEAVRILLAAGGDPFATDHLGRNMLHLVLVNPGGFTITFQSRDALRAILGLLDNSTRQTLLLQGSSEHPGNVTPLASWLYENCGFGWMPEHRDEVLSLILDASNESELEIQDGSGMMPLDIVRIS